MKKLGGVILILVIVKGALAGGFALSGVGIEMLEIGGAARAVTNDPSSIFWNPGALGFAKTRKISTGLEFIMPEARFQPMTGLVGYDGGYSNRLDVYAKAQTFKIPSLLVQLPFKYATFSFGFFVPFGLGSKWDLYDYPLGWHNPYPYPEYDWTSDLKVLSFYLGVAHKFGNKFSLGLSGGLNQEKVELRETKLERIVLPDGTIPPLPYSYAPVDVKLKGDGNGFGVNLGALYKANDKLSIGISARFYSVANLTGTIDMVAYLPESTSDFNAWRLSSHSDAEVKFPLPHNAGIGISYKGGEGLYFLADLDYSFWNMFDELSIKLKNGYDPLGNPLDSIVIAKHWSGTFRASLGMIYALNELTTLRFGIYYDQSPIPEGSQDPLIPDIGDKLSFNAGITRKIEIGKNKNLYLNLGGELISVSDRTVRTFEDINSDSEPDNMPGIYSLSIGTISLGIAFEF